MVYNNSINAGVTGYVKADGSGSFSGITDIPVADGGTGNNTFTAYSIIAAGTTATGPFQNISGLGTSGQILTSNGAGVLPTWQNAPTGSGVNTLTGNSGGAISPTSGNINTVGTGSITIAGSGSTLTTQLTGLTNHNVLLGAGTTTIGLAAPSATAGIPLVSGGASADPSFTTAVVAGGGTGNTTFTAYSVVAAGTTATGAFQSVGTGTAGQVLTSAGASALPTWQTPSTGGVTTIDGDTGSATPTAGVITVSGGTTGLTTSASSSTVDLTGTLKVDNGGTGATTFTAYGVVCAGTTATGAFQNVVGVGTSGQVLTSAGPGALPAWSSAAAGGFTSVNVQTFTTSGTYTPTSGMKYASVICIAGGGGGGGSVTSTAGNTSCGGAGGSGEYAYGLFDAATIGASQSVTVGAAGTVATATAGGDGGDSSFGALMNCIGGKGGSISASASTTSAQGGIGGTGGTGGNYRVAGQEGGDAYFNGSSGINLTGSGGSTPLGLGGNPGYGYGPLPGTGYGSGGGGSGADASNVTNIGGAAGPGIVIITEYIS